MGSNQPPARGVTTFGCPDSSNGDRQTTRDEGYIVEMLYPSPLQPQPIITAGKRGPARLESQCFFHQKNRDAAWPFTLYQEELRHEATKPTNCIHTLGPNENRIFPKPAA